MFKDLTRRLFSGREFIITFMILLVSICVNGQFLPITATDISKLPDQSINGSSGTRNNLKSGMAEFGYIPVYDKNPSDYNIFTVFTGSTYSVLNIFAPNGVALYYKILNDYGYDFKLLPDNTLSYFDQERLGYVIMDEYFNEIDFIVAKNGFETDFHELFYHDNAYFLLAKDKRVMDMSTMAENGKVDAEVVGIVIQKIDKEHNLLFEWNSFDHFNIKDSYANLSLQVVDPFHINSIEMDTDTTILISSRNLNEITKISLNTGEIIWRMGGENNEFEFVGFDRPFSGQHTLKRREGNLYTLFDNGLYLEPEYSRGLIIEINEEQRQVKMIREFRHTPDIYSRIVGNIQNLENGNFLIYWGIDAGLEVEGNFTVYRDDYVIIERGKLHNNLAYRVFKFDWRPKNFSSDEEVLIFPDTEPGQIRTVNLNLTNNTPKTILIDELKWKNESFQINADNPITLLPGSSYPLAVSFSPMDLKDIEDTLTLRSNSEKEGFGIQVLLKGKGVEETSNDNFNSIEVTLYPVPFHEKLHYKTPKIIQRIQLMDISGKILLDEQSPDSTGAVDTSSLQSGVYIFSMQFEGNETYRKIVIKE